MKKVLLLTYDFPPYISVGGLRPYSWYRYMQQFGIYPIVVTRQWDNKYGNQLDYIAPSESHNTITEKTKYGTLIKTAYKPNFSNRLFLKFGDKKFKLIRKILSAFYEITQYLFPIGPKSELYFAAKKYLQNEKVDVIIATGDPFVLFKYASKLSDKYNIPWIADYRDPWSDDISIKKYIFYQKWCKFLEKKIVPKASRRITVSEFLGHKITSLVKVEKIDILPNGYDSELIGKVEDINQGGDKFSIAYMGTIYDWYPLDEFLAVCMQFVNDVASPNFQINFYGVNKENEIRSMLEVKYMSLTPYVKIFPKQQNALILKQLAINNVFLLFNNYSFLGTKIFDYLALKRQIIFCYTDDEESKKLKEQYYLIEELEGSFQQLQENMIKETNSGINVKNSIDLKKLMNDLYQEFIENGEIKCKSVNTEQYSRKIQAKKLADIIHNL